MDDKNKGKKEFLDFFEKYWRSKKNEASIDSSVDDSLDMELRPDEAAGAVGGAPPPIGPQPSPEQIEQEEAQRLQEKLALAGSDPAKVAAALQAHMRRGLSFERNDAVVATQRISDRVERLEDGVRGIQDNINRLADNLQQVVRIVGQPQQQQQQQNQQPPQQHQPPPQQQHLGAVPRGRMGPAQYQLSTGDMLKRLAQAVKPHDTLQAKNASAFNHWWQNIEAYLKINECDQAQYYRVAMCFMYTQLANDLQNAVKTIRPYSFNNPVPPSEYADMLKAILLPAYTPELQLELFRSMKQKHQQTLSDYFNRLKEAYTGANMTEFMQFKAQFLSSIRSKKIKQTIIERRPANFDQLLNTALAAEQEMYTLYRAHPDKDTREALNGCWSVLDQDTQMAAILNRRNTQLPEVEPMEVELMSANDQLEEVNIFGDEPGDEQVIREETDEDRAYWLGDCQAMTTQVGSGRKCYQCQKPGHLKRQCPQRRTGGRGRGAGPGARGAPRQYTSSRPWAGRGRGSAPPVRTWSKETLARTLAQISAQLQNQDFRTGVSEEQKQ